MIQKKLQISKKKNKTDLRLIKNASKIKRFKIQLQYSNSK